MANIIIWHNPRCRKSREGLNYLRERNIEPKIFDYLKEQINPSELAKLIKITGQPLGLFIRKNEKEYKELGLKDMDLTAETFAEFASKYPKLLQRPIVVKGNKAILVRPASRIDEVL